MNVKRISMLLWLLVAAAAGAEEADNDCMEGPMAEFGRYVGDWTITDVGLKPDGSAWEPGPGARWVFKCIGDGTAVQDFWMPNNGGYGTNLRTYNPDTGAWEIVWATKGLNGLMHIAASLDDDGNVVMDILKPEQPQPRRIIFFAPDDGGWSWVQQWSFDDRETWVDVYRIRATPYTDE